MVYRRIMLVTFVGVAGMTVGVVLDGKVAADQSQKAADAPALLARHQVDDLVVTCIDFRFHDDLPQALRGLGLGIEDYDLVAVAGGAGNLAKLGVDEHRKQVVLEDIKLAVEAHHIKRVILLDHVKCGKYADRLGCTFTDDNEECEFHRQELREARKLLRAAHPQLTVLIGYFNVSAPDSRTARIMLY